MNQSVAQSGARSFLRTFGTTLVWWLAVVLIFFGLGKILMAWGVSAQEEFEKKRDAFDLPSAIVEEIPKPEKFLLIDGFDFNQAEAMIFWAPQETFEEALTNGTTIFVGHGFYDGKRKSQYTAYWWEIQTENDLAWMRYNFFYGQEFDAMNRGFPENNIYFYWKRDVDEENFRATLEAHRRDDHGVGGLRQEVAEDFYLFGKFLGKYFLIAAVCFILLVGWKFFRPG